jgi:hypothetical protein
MHGSGWAYPDIYNLYIYIYNIYMYIYIYSRTFTAGVCIYVCVCERESLCVYVRQCAHVLVCLSVRVCVGVCTWHAGTQKKASGQWSLSITRLAGGERGGVREGSGPMNAGEEEVPQASEVGDKGRGERRGRAGVRGT